jgi:hypothetical protein
MAKLTDERRRALRILSRHPDGRAEAVLLADGFNVGQLAVLEFDGLAEMRRTSPTSAADRGRSRG